MCKKEGEKSQLILLLRQVKKLSIESLQFDYCFKPSDNFEYVYLIILPFNLFTQWDVNYHKNTDANYWCGLQGATNRLIYTKSPAKTRAHFCNDHMRLLAGKASFSLENL
jgi:hypothetical protein